MFLPFLFFSVHFVSLQQNVAMVKETEVGSVKFRKAHSFFFSFHPHILFLWTFEADFGLKLQA